MIWSRSPWNESVYTYMWIQQAFIEHLMVGGIMQVLLTKKRMSASVFFGAHIPTMDKYIDTTWYALSYMHNALSNSVS